jgi:hypothetical protein
VTEPATCASCGRSLAPGARFCTGCGAGVPVPAAPAPEPAAPVPPASDPVPRTPDQTPHWALGTPPANERWWHNPIVIVGTILTVLLGSGVASWRVFFAESGGTTSIVRALAPQGASSPDGGATTQAAPTTGTTPQSSAADVSTPVLQIQQLLRRSETGLVAAREQRDYAAALRNRESIEAALARIDVSAGPQRFQQAYATLRAAIRASAHADGRHIDCGCDTLLPADVAATRLKRRFARLFDPYARQYLGGPVDPDRI